MFKSILGDPNARKLKKYKPLVNDIKLLEEEIEPLSDEELRGKTAEFRARLAKARNLDEEKQILDDILPEAFAVVREAGKRVLGMRHFDVQLIGGMVLHDGQIAEMKTGEGKTLVSTLPAYLNALSGKGVHVVTVNDYLAKRDAEWMGQVHRFLGLSVGLIQQNMAPAERQKNYACDVTYATNSELGFDYLRDNMATSMEEVVQRPFNFCVIDEVDSVLIDEARTPLIISGQVERPTEKYLQAADVARSLKRDDHYEVDEKQRNILLTDEGFIEAEKLLGVSDLFDPNDPWAHYVFNAIKAKELFINDVNYIVRSGEIVIVDEFTGRVMPGRRWSDGLHQAIEAKEGVDIQNETQTLATITYQNFFLLYPKLAGMTGTAKTEEAELEKIYKLEVTQIPTNRERRRVDLSDVVYKTEAGDLTVFTREAAEKSEQGRPVLIWVMNLEALSNLSQLLDKQGLAHNLCPGLPQSQEQAKEILRQAKHPGMITVTNSYEVYRMIRQGVPEGENGLFVLGITGKWSAIALECDEMHRTGRPVLVGTTSVEKSELLSQLLQELNVPHNLLNAKPENVERESEIIAQAGRKGKVTIATNMAGRGTDIILGGNSDYMARLKIREYFMPRIVEPEDDEDFSGMGFAQDQRGGGQGFGLATKIKTWKAKSDIYPVELSAETEQALKDAVHVAVQQYGERSLPELEAEDKIATAAEKAPTTDLVIQKLREVYKLIRSEYDAFTDREHEEVVQLGGLHVIGTERHESRRIDNQLRGRAGRQGDPGSTKFFLSLQDNLLRIFGGDRVAGMMNAFRVEEDMPIESKMLTRSLEGAQKKVETYYYDIRKQVFEYDEVMNNQRRAIYAERRRVLEGQDLKEKVIEYAERTMDDIVEAYINPELPPEEWELDKLVSKVQEFVYLLQDMQPEDLADMTLSEMKAFLHEQARIAYDLKEAEVDSVQPGLMRQAERFFILNRIDTLWREHLQAMDGLRESVGLRGYGQKDPLIEYKSEGYELFLEMMINIRRDVVYSLFQFQPQQPQPQVEVEVV
ncbi:MULTISPECIES: preprotein translocase subunit SecA [Leptolyngbya]|jgi:preprotein translocase subunit SecA|uniref:Protein translocase subunit SecA n=2 Tax=Leptolyngbya boryana TaxID=1184 RepID=A0A1Z4JQ14_LEPBY|nr:MULTISPECIES: preprotein translocase subunit SecA [Leptolyngbya]BAY58728.1 preprotein translocase SecA subunit [Leptolyngbya boryana NIES-2135]MCY6489334.1 preprotein translocase subunit SecA [Leptolyngbya sp. GGD]ULP29782.1 preprotein translocase subunit SecA [Leptolyngbya boryana IU 594]WNZ48082.1 preprotein translocase subunit SecA [Leptolyngbya boryana CZ1]BAS55130.1 preprotein translocase subunit secA [Leptolyngbya boryana IAM M-101]